MTQVELPLFPLSTVLFPGGPVSLRIFEPRYLGMVSRCMREMHGFGVVLIDSGSEVGEAQFVGVGTVAEIVDWHRRRDGLLGIEAQGRERFRVVRSRRQADGLYVGDLEPLPREPQIAFPDAFESLRGLLRSLLEELGAQYARITPDYDDATWVGYRLAELLPLSGPARQALLELEDPLERLEALRRHAEQIETRTA
jgi:hypothetical protein